MASTSKLPGWFARAIEALRVGDVDGYLDIYAPDAVHEFPFAPEGAVRRLEGREAIAAYMRRLPEHIRFGELDNVRVRESGDEVIIEATGHHRSIPDDTPMDLGYVWFITRRDGQVMHLRDYMSSR
jgi:ketosteroid isomerase-like protein